MKNIYVITGGATGIGYATALSLKGENNTIILCGRSEDKLKKAVEELNKENINAEYFVCDTSNRQDVTKLANYAKSLGIIKGVVNSAGVSGSNNTPEQIFKINSLGTVYINQEFYKVMEGGCICDVASCSAYLLPETILPTNLYPLALSNENEFITEITKNIKSSQVAYCTSKNFVKWYAAGCSYKYAKEKNIRVVSVSPGFVHTPMTEVEANTPGTMQCLHYSGFDRGAKPEEIGFLISTILDERNSYLTGTDILIDGGTVAAGFNASTTSNPENKPVIEYNY